ncbi:hypothetical protein CRUP_024449 [Coryphaenoides rupestris]|nr:hypothetical protein CRUP_024449 [Coryphaenoides rupestris]
MASKCPKCDKTVYFAEKVSSLGKDWHKFCLKCERCNKTLTPGGHAEVRPGCPRAASFTSFSGGPNECPRCNKTVYFAEKVSSLGKNWHRPCLRCERCSKTLTPGSHAEHDGQPYCHKPCYAVLFGPKGVNTGGVGSYIYDESTAEPQP